METAEDEMAQLQKDIDAERKKAMRFALYLLIFQNVSEDFPDPLFGIYDFLLLFFPPPSLWT